MLAEGTVLGGKYKIVRPLGTGGMGAVYEAIQTDLGRRVAVKLLHEDVAADEGLAMRFRREAETVAALGHPNIVQIVEFKNEHGQRPMLVMEKLDGKSLREVLLESGSLPPPRAVRIVVQILSALASMHRARIVHRDIKPGNIFVTETLAVRDFVKVLDFGIAKVDAADQPKLTELGQVLGTASYMAPEQARGLPVDGRADIFAVGCLLFEALSGKRPRENVSNMIQVGREPCRPLLDVMPTVDRELAAVVDRALKLDREARFPDAESMVRALEPFAVERAQVDATVVDAPATRPSVESTAPMPAPPRRAPPPVVAYSPSAPPAPPRSYTWLFVLVPILAVAGIVVVASGLLGLGFYGLSKERDLLTATKPTKCREPYTCNGRADVQGKSYGYCAKSPARIGDVVIVQHGSRTKAGTVSDLDGPDRYVVKDPAAGSIWLQPGELLGPYCAP